MLLVGREPERRALAGLAAAARVGRSGTLVLTGEAGIGKTALLEDCATGAGAGMRALRATGTESEAEVPFGGLLQLLRPALVHLDRIPAPQAAALSAALALTPGTGGDRFAVGAATLSLLSRYAEDGPVLVLLDDAHWLDLPSAQALAFAARRLTADPIAVLATVRDGHPGPFPDAGLPVLRVGGLSVAATGDLLAAAGRRPGDAAVARLHELTGGNPLAVAELADRPVEPLPFGTPDPVPASLARVFAARADRLSAAARTAVLAAAAAGGDLAVIAGACARLGVDVAALDEAAEAGLLRVTDDGVVFRHGLVRSAVWSDAAPADRRAVHRALAGALPAADTDRRAWHLGEAALGPDAAVARTLAEVAAAAARRSAHAVAAGTYERAARLSPDVADRVERYVDAGESAWRAGLGERALLLLDRAARLGPAPPVRARIAGLRGSVATRTGAVQEARDLLLAAGAEAAGTDPDAAVQLYADAILACLFLGDTGTVRTAAAVIDGLVDRAGTDRARLVGAVAGGVAGVLTGDGGPTRIRWALRAAGPVDELAADPRIVPWLVMGPLFLRESGSGQDLIRTVVDGLRRRTALGGLPFVLFAIGRDQATTDRWDLAEVTYAEGIHLAREAGLDADLAACVAGLAWLEARQGRAAECREHAAEAAAVSGARHIGLFRCWSLWALGDLALGLGRPEEAIEHFGRLAALLAELGLADVDLDPAPELAEALVRVGREGEARAAATAYAARAEAKGQPWALARAARALALTGPDLDQFEVALGHHARTVDAYETARTRLAYGSRLRRARRRVDARPVLRSALSTLEALGAAPWADQAAVELRATGETAVRRGAGARDLLTPQELQVATMLAAGRTTREAAAALFLSPKTVEYHLRHVYVKLDIRSRPELPTALGGPAP